MRRRLQILGWALIWSGVFIVGYLGWQLYVTDFLNGGVQAEAQEDLTGALVETPSQPETIDLTDLLGNPPPAGVPESVDFTEETAAPIGDPFAFMRIPSIGVDHVVFEGVDSGTLKRGPGHMANTPLPGQPGNSVISGHRTTYGRPFFDFDQLVVGDRIEIESFSGVHVYEVREIVVVQPTDVWVTDPRAGGWLTLTTCNPKFSARERLVVWAEMVEGPNLEYIQLHESGVLS